MPRLKLYAQHAESYISKELKNYPIIIERQSEAFTKGGTFFFFFFFKSIFAYGLECHGEALDPEGVLDAQCLGISNSNKYKDL